MKSLDCYARRKRYFRKVMMMRKQKNYLDWNQWEKDTVYDIIGTLLLGAIIVAMMML